MISINLYNLKYNCTKNNYKIKEANNRIDKQNLVISSMHSINKVHIKIYFTILPVCTCIFSKNNMQSMHIIYL